MKDIIKYGFLLFLIILAELGLRMALFLTCLNKRSGV